MKTSTQIKIIFNVWHINIMQKWFKHVWHILNTQKNKIPCIFKNLKFHGNQITTLKCTLYYYSWATKGKEILFKVFFFTLRKDIQEGLHRCCHNSVIFQQQGGSVLVLNAHRFYLPFNIFFWALCFSDCCPGRGR